MSDYERVVQCLVEMEASIEKARGPMPHAIAGMLMQVRELVHLTKQMADEWKKEEST